MSFFSNSVVQPKPQIIHKAPAVARSSEKPATVASQRVLQSGLWKTSSAKINGNSRRAVGKLPRSSPSKLLKRGASKRASTTVQRFSSSDEESGDSDGSLDFPRKTLKSSSASTEPDLNRTLLYERSISDTETHELALIHGAELASGDTSHKYRAAFADDSTPGHVELQYPSAYPPERFQLVEPSEKDEYKPLEDIIQSIEQICGNFLPPEVAAKLLDDSNGLPRKLKRALRTQSEDDFKAVLEDFNNSITSFQENGTVSSIIQKRHSVSLPLIERILGQVYSRTVSPRVGSLRKYENGTDNVYGELLPRFISRIFSDTKLKSNQIFVDLGSGVGNVLLQAALETGCESWGCEVMENPCKLAELQKKEFEARCRLWGLAVGSVHLVRGDFLENKQIGDILQKADVVLVNNQAFNPELNDSLISLFLDLKEGCQIVSLKSFVPAGHKLAERNMSNPVNLLTARKKEYYSNSVSWTDQGGNYFVAKKDSSRLREFIRGRK